MINYFADLFKATDTDWEYVVNYISSTITADQNSEFLLPVEENEVKRTLFHMHPNKSLGLMV